MRAVQIAQLDGPGSVRVVDVDEPDGTDQVLVDVHAAGVAFPDALLTRGLYQYKPDLPFTPGAEIAGVVRNAPAGSGLSAGDRVAGLTMLSGGMAQVVALAPDQVFRLPEAVSFEAGAGLLFNDLTVHCALRTRGRLAQGETVLVHGAAGGIGTSTLRLAPAFGAGRTIAVVSTEEKVAVAQAAGADDVVLADGFKDAVKELTGGRGVDVVVDPVGGDRFTDSLRSLAPGGRLREGEPASAQQRRCGRSRLGGLDFRTSRLRARAVGRARAVVRHRCGVRAAARCLPARPCSRSHCRTGESDRQGKGRHRAAVSAQGAAM